MTDRDGGQQPHDGESHDGGRHGHGRHRPWQGAGQEHPEDPTRPRLFFAVPLPDPARDAVSELAARVQASVDGEGAHIRWVRMEGLHFTLRFLGPTPEARLPELETLVDATAAASAPFDVRISGAGAFPSPDHPRTLWLGLTAGATELAALASVIEDGVVRGGEALETRPFAPHLTIARTDGVRAAPRAARILGELAADLDVAFRADRLVLYRSHLGHGRATYEPLHEARLGG